MSGKMSKIGTASPVSSFTYDLLKVTIEIKDARTGQTIGKPDSHGASTLTLRKDRSLKTSMSWTPADNTDNAFKMSWVMLIYCGVSQLCRIDLGDLSLWSNTVTDRSQSEITFGKLWLNLRYPVQVSQMRILHLTFKTATDCSRTIEIFRRFRLRCRMSDGDLRQRDPLHSPTPTSINSSPSNAIRHPIHRLSPVTRMLASTPPPEPHARRPVPRGDGFLPQSGQFYRTPQHQVISPHSPLSLSDRISGASLWRGPTAGRNSFAFPFADGFSPAPIPTHPHWVRSNPGFRCGSKYPSISPQFPQEFPTANEHSVKRPSPLSQSPGPIFGDDSALFSSDSITEGTRGFTPYSSTIPSQTNYDMSSPAEDYASGSSVTMGRESLDILGTGDYDSSLGPAERPSQSSVASSRGGNELFLQCVDLALEDIAVAESSQLPKQSSSVQDTTSVTNRAPVNAQLRLPTKPSSEISVDMRTDNSTNKKASRMSLEEEFLAQLPPPRKLPFNRHRSKGSKLTNKRHRRLGRGRSISRTSPQATVLISTSENKAPSVGKSVDAAVQTEAQAAFSRRPTDNSDRDLTATQSPTRKRIKHVHRRRQQVAQQDQGVQCTQRTDLTKDACVETTNEQPDAAGEEVQEYLPKGGLAEDALCQGHLMSAVFDLVEDFRDRLCEVVDSYDEASKSETGEFDASHFAWRWEMIKTELMDDAVLRYGEEVLNVVLAGLSARTYLWREKMPNSSCISRGSPRTISI